MDRFKKERNGVRATITKVVSEVDTQLKKDAVDKSVLRAKFKRLNQLNQEIHRLDRDILDALLDEDAAEAEMEAEQGTADEFIQKILISRDQIETYLEAALTAETKNSSDGASVTSSATTSTRNFKLPKIELKKLRGELKEWIGWWAQFSKIHDDETIDPADKYDYLYLATVEGSKAREVVESYPDSAENYPKVIERMKERFGKPKLLKQFYVRELLKLVSTSTKGVGADQVSTLYYALDSHTRSLSTLGVTTEQAAEFLYPMVESCLPEDLLTVWQRHPTYLKDGTKEDPPMTELSYLLDFLRIEVENQEQRKLTRSEGSSSQKSHKLRKSEKEFSQEELCTSAGLFEGKEKCLFCHKTNHQSHECMKALNMSLDEKQGKVKEANSCFVCFKPRPRCKGAKQCKAPVRCSVCSRKHYHFMCPELAAIKLVQTKSEKTCGNDVPEASPSSTRTVAGNSGVHCGGEVLLKTVLVRVLGKGGVKLLARLLFDEGSQSSYVTTHIIKGLSSKPVGEERVRTVMIDGKVSAGTLFYKHQVTLQDETGKQRVKLVLRERPVIGGIPPRAQVGQWCQELKNQGITIEDHGGSRHEREDIDILIGSDFREQLMTGRRVLLKEGIYAVESVFGWMLCGPIFKTEVSASEMVTQSYLTGSVTQLWDLEVLGIRDSAQKVTSKDNDKKIKEEFQSQVTRAADGRYVVKLPWINQEVKSQLPSNEAVCIKRLEAATKKLKGQGKFHTYDDIFRGWEDEGIIEVPADVDPNSGHYLPHRPVFKESVTTPVRPVFDASCHIWKRPSLNQCLEKGPNWLELIPAMLVRFREKKVGVISDIRKAFQMVSVSPEDRNYQKFYWWRSDKEKSELKPYQHCRVVFGLTCSPFILAAILDFHLSQVDELRSSTAVRLKRSLYVDNCVTSFDQEEEYRQFRIEATAILNEARMELRQWESQIELSATDPTITTVLGLKWDRVTDTLFCQIPKQSESEEITKRTVLSLVAQIFDPIGYSCPALLQPKLMLQEAWATDLGWDDKWEDERQTEFHRWCTGIDNLERIRIPRCAIGLNTTSPGKVQLHVFTDASQAAYAGVVFVRVVRAEEVSVQLIAAKARVAPLDKKKKNRVTIPRLELLGCLVGARLFEASREALEMKELETHFWTDSTTALSWIRREGDWGTFVGNRVAEIVKLTGGTRWRHVPGVMNPADLPSRGCSPKELLESKWWEGPDWLRKQESEWPKVEEDADEDLVNSEKRKTSLVAIQIQSVEPRLSTYLKNVRAAAWVRRFITNSKSKADERVKSPYLGRKEMMVAEADMIKEIQKKYFDKTPTLKNLDVERGENGLLHVKTRLTYRMDSDQFKKPVLMPREDPLVHQLIQHIHRSSGHGGTQFVLGKLRERYWITQGRKTVGSIIKKCVVCKRHKGPSMQTQAAPLPKARVETVFAFQTTGVDLAGPLVLKGGDKAWIVLYTCAVYRGIHLDLVQSLSTEAFLASLERFVNLVGRPNRIYSDGGTNFVGTKNIMKILDWKKIKEEFQVREINWTLNPPAAPWWGGWWERLVRSTKELLRRMLGTAKLTHDELLTCLASVAGTINDRPLTTLSEDGEDLIPLTPRMFMRDLPIAIFPEAEDIGEALLRLGPNSAKELRKAYKKLQGLKESLRARFRKEYLAMLVQRGAEKPTPEPKVGDIVLIGSDDKKRFQWPLGKIVELMTGTDKKIRVAKVKVGNRSGDPQDFRTTFLTRPLQRLYPLEMSTWEERIKDIRTEVGQTVKDKVMDEEKEDDDTSESAIFTRKGRRVKKPQRYGVWNH